MEAGFFVSWLASASRSLKTAGRNRACSRGRCDDCSDGCDLCPTQVSRCVRLLFGEGRTIRPAEFQDLWPKSWWDLAAEAARKGAVKYDGQWRKMHLVLLVAKGPDDMAHLIRTIQW